MSDLAGLMDDLRQTIATWGDLKFEAGKLQRELAFAKYLAGDVQTLESAPKEVAELLVGAATIW